MIIWNPWHGCRKISEGCQHCYMYFLDKKRGIDTANVFKTENFNLPMQKNRNGKFKILSGMTLYVGLSTDFFIEEADQWRDKAWQIMRNRPDVAFRLLTKRANRIKDCLPSDWGNGYENVMLSVTCENQRRADERLPILIDIPAKHKGFMAAPFIGPIDADKYLSSNQFEEVLCGGENYDGARPCHYEWVESLSNQCLNHNVTFNFIETGSTFVKNGKTYHISSKRIQSQQAFLSGLSHKCKTLKFKLRNPESTLFSNGLEQKILPYTPLFFRDCCNTCGSRLTCNGCSNCGQCDV